MVAVSRDTDKAGRERVRDYSPRTLKAGAEIEPRPSVADEQLLTDEVRVCEDHERQLALRDTLGHLRVAQREVDAIRSLHLIDHQTRRDLARIRQAISRIRERHA
jgi:hypothetical protein